MEDNIIEIPIAEVKTPEKTPHLKNASGFSLTEIRQAEQTIDTLKKLNVRIDYFRKSSYDENVNKLKELKAPIPKGKKREPFVKREKKSKKSFKGVKEEKVVEKAEVKKPAAKKKAAPKKKAETQEKPEAVKKLKAEPVEKIEPKAKKEAAEGIPLTQLPGLGMTTAKKFENLGVTTVQELIEEDASELSQLIKGCSEVKIETWQKQGKDLL